MRDLRSPVFLHVDGGGILINLMFGLASVRRDGRLRAKQRKLRFARKTIQAVTGKMTKTGICP
ncbi:hypothetical protein GKC96_00345 [Lactobacillus ruminis]|nr:hypothetical protein [Ligilactobacillus ruminis]RYS80390.1 hypothetical protein EAI77_03260 [Ligilactobacillus ruminis]